ncbi:MAG: type II secretion system protein GspG [Planctomycetaceae bacterium]|nr:type II secretion system protein GspG [Planctomycetaceae bacterium]
MKRLQQNIPSKSARGRQSARHGFTLIELLIVMAILVLLVSMVGPRLLGSKAKADINATKIQIGMFQASLERYAIDMNTFPTKEQGLEAMISEPSGDSSGGSDDGGDDLELEGDDFGSSGGGSNWDGPYLKADTLPNDAWGNSFGYEFPATHNRQGIPDIWSFGPDGQENTEDDITSWGGSNTGESGGSDEFRNEDE